MRDLSLDLESVVTELAEGGVNALEELHDVEGSSFVVEGGYEIGFVCRHSVINYGDAEELSERMGISFNDDACLEIEGDNNNKLYVCSADGGFYTQVETDDDEEPREVDFHEDAASVAEQIEGFTHDFGKEVPEEHDEGDWDNDYDC